MINAKELARQLDRFLKSPTCQDARVVVKLPQGEFHSPDGYFDIKVGQGVLTNWNMWRCIGTYKLKHNVFFDLILARRNIKSDNELFNDKSFFIGLGIRMNSLSFKHDF